MPPGSRHLATPALLRPRRRSSEGTLSSTASERGQLGPELAFASAAVDPGPSLGRRSRPTRAIGPAKPRPPIWPCLAPRSRPRTGSRSAPVARPAARGARGTRVVGSKGCLLARGMEAVPTRRRVGRDRRDPSGTPPWQAVPVPRAGGRGPREHGPQGARVAPGRPEFPDCSRLGGQSGSHRRAQRPDSRH